jgi:hypothetical protein
LTIKFTLSSSPRVKIHILLTLFLHDCRICSSRQPAKPCV